MRGTSLPGMQLGARLPCCTSVCTAATTRPPCHRIHDMNAVEAQFSSQLSGDFCHCTAGLAVDHSSRARLPECSRVSGYRAASLRGPSQWSPEAQGHDGGGGWRGAHCAAHGSCAAVAELQAPLHVNLASAARASWRCLSGAPFLSCSDSPSLAQARKCACPHAPSRATLQQRSRLCGCTRNLA